MTSIVICFIVGILIGQLFHALALLLAILTFLVFGAFRLALLDVLIGLAALQIGYVVGMGVRVIWQRGRTAPPGDSNRQNGPAR